jgi:hypothetical protein
LAALLWRCGTGGTGMMSIVLAAFPFKVKKMNLLLSKASRMPSKSLI